MAELTPMKKQYQEIKSHYGDCLLFYRLGDFYEMFDDDAITASQELELTLTTRDRGKPKDEQTPMCGVPYHSCEAYIARLLARGYKVAICEQTEDPKLTKGLVRRDVVRVITPGTVTESSMLREELSNYLAAVCMAGERGAAAFCDVTTGEFKIASFTSEAAVHISNQLAAFAPREAVLSGEALALGRMCAFLRESLHCVIERGARRFDEGECSNRVEARYGKSPAKLGLTAEAALAAGALMSYLADTHPNALDMLGAPELCTDGRFMELDYTAQRTLELTETLRGDTEGSLLSVMDSAVTPMGRRRLRSWVTAPLTSAAMIRERLECVRELSGDNVRRAELRSALSHIGDMQRITARAVFKTAQPKELHSLGVYLAAVPRLQELAGPFASRTLAELRGIETPEPIFRRILDVISDSAPGNLADGKVIRPGVNPELDRLRDLSENSSLLLAGLEARERERTGIKKLRVGYNKVFGYYMDVPRSADPASLPDDFIRRQTLVSSERYVTEELKQLESDILTARERIELIESEMFRSVRDYVAENADWINAIAEQLATLDALCAFAENAVRFGYCEPVVDESGAIDIEGGRHPVVEQKLTGSRFVPNDTHLSSEDRVAIITGPNMAGKSTYMRQTALIVLMAQMGSFVPASRAHIGVVDRVFTRIGASDDLAGGKSTFMVEMREVADMLAAATKNSLLILDEIGRGTSTYDGMAIARAVLEHCGDESKLGAKTMFATHYHELSALENTLPGVRNFNISARKQGDELVFLRKIVPGAADDSYGIEVAKLAGVPDSVIERARLCLGELESGAPEQSSPCAAAPRAAGPVGDSGRELLKRLRDLQPDAMTPIEAMNALYQLKKEAADCL